jgi:hypothetical protein
VSMKESLRRVKHRILALDARLITALSELNGVVPPANNVGSKSTESPEKNIGQSMSTKVAAVIFAGELKGRAGDGYR